MWDSRQAWTDVSELGIYHPHRCKSTKLKNPAMRVFHRFMTYTFNGRKETNGNVMIKDLLFMEAAVAGRQVNTSKLLIKKLKEIQEEKGDIYWRMIVTLICEKLGLEITPIDESNKIKFSTNNLVRDATLCKMGLIRKNMAGEWFVIKDEMEEDATVQADVPNLERAIQEQVSLHKRRRTTTKPGSSQNVPEISSESLDEIVGRLERMERKMQEQQDQLQHDFYSLTSRIEEIVDILGERMTEISTMMKNFSTTSSSSQPPPPAL